MPYSISTTTATTNKTFTIHSGIARYTVVSDLFKELVDTAKNNGCIVRYDFESLKGNTKPIVMRAIVTADNANSASYTIDLNRL